MTLIAALTVVLVPEAWADRLYWTAPPSPADSDALERTLPGIATLPIDALIAGAEPAADPSPALETLRRELAGVRPLVSEFDGELQIMARLSKATADVTALRSPEDTELLWRALCFEGFAVQRYFGERLGTDPAAAPYRVGEGAGAMVAPWLDAAALFGPREPIAEDIPEAPQRIAFDGVRAAVTVMPAASLALGQLASGATVRLDGRAVDTTAQQRTLLVPGRHFVEVTVGDTVLLRGDTRLGGGSTMSAEAPFGPTERDALVALAAGAAGWAVPAAAMAPIQGAKEPVFLAVPGDGRPTLIRVDHGTAEGVAVVMPAAPNSGFTEHLALGGGWISTGDFFLLNSDAAPYDASSVNAASIAVAGDVQWHAGVFATSLGASLAMATGGYHQLPTGGSVTREFFYPHAGVGLKWVQATVGPMFPWYLGLGAKARVAVLGDIEVTGSFTYGLPFTIAREEGEPDFEPEPLYAAWGGLGWRFD